MTLTAQAAAEEHAANSCNWDRPLVLVVDDDKITHGLVQKFLKTGGLDYSGVPSGEEALRFLETRIPDVILTDFQMPGIDGIELCRAIRAHPSYKDIPVILFTAASNIGTLHEAFEAGANDYLVKPLRDIELVSRAKRHAIEFRRKTESKSRIQALNKQNESKTRVLGVASHDLRNPIVSIRGISQFLSSEKFGNLNESQKEMVDTITDASESMLTLIEDLLDMTKIESDSVEMKKEPLGLGELLHHSLRLNQSVAAKKGISIKLVDHSDGSTALLDKKLMTRVVDNLVSNAIKFTFPNTIVYLVADSFNDFVSLAVEDEGPGIPEGEFDKLFKEFGRTSNLPTGGESSSGIGLFVVKRIVESHGGEIIVENRPQGGSRFQANFKRI